MNIKKNVHGTAVWLWRIVSGLVPPALMCSEYIIEAVIEDYGGAFVLISNC